MATNVLPPTHLTDGQVAILRESLQSIGFNWDKMEDRPHVVQAIIDASIDLLGQGGKAFITGGDKETTTFAQLVRIHAIGGR